MKQAIVAIEDKRFYEHRGVDVHGILRASGPTSTGGPVRGRLDDHAAVRQEHDQRQRADAVAQAQEAALAWKLEQEWTKDRILTAYLNTIYFGNGAYGVEEASQSTSATAPTT